MLLHLILIPHIKKDDLAHFKQRHSFIETNRFDRSTGLL